jgi:4'-phosphopantetheinyl transferase
MAPSADEQALLVVYPWPASRELIAATPQIDRSPILISVVTSLSAPRDAARTQLRQAVLELLCLQLGLTPDAVVLDCTPGRAMRVNLTGHHIRLSASHEQGISVAAIYRSGPVGIDIVRIPPAFDWQQIALDYLGPQVVAGIVNLPCSQKMPAFAREWTRLEARLKCLGVGLQEWSVALESRMQACCTVEIELPAGLVGCCAVLRFADQRM